MFKEKKLNRRKIHAVINIIVVVILIGITFSQDSIEKRMFFSRLTLLFALISSAVASKYNGKLSTYKILIVMAIFVLVMTISSYLIHF
ncbi:MAG TPA: hypothetical protein DHN33_05665 [Eubacteriaceae bacterium]|nr:hypothetical protein [Eubacteriaceae bacterium]